MVYRAVDEVLGRDVAIKVIRTGGPGHVQDTLRARFRREAKAAAQLHHPNIISVFSFGSDNELAFDFLVMELLHGRDLAAQLRESGPPPLPKALDILSGAVRGVAAGHRAGLVHRDIKPSNLFLSEDEDTGTIHVRVLDFGIAQFLVDGDTQTHLTVLGYTPLSPAYASPEQLRGDTVLSPASDVFSLGATAYELFTGKPATTPGMRADLSMGLRVKARSMRKFVPAIPSELDALIRKALAPKPAERYQDAGEFLRALQALSKGPVTLPEATVKQAPVYTPPTPLPEETAFLPSKIESGETALHGKVIRDTLRRHYGWNVTLRGEDTIEVRPARSVVSAEDFPDEVLSAVRRIGYRATLLSVRDASDNVCIKFRTSGTHGESKPQIEKYTAESKAPAAREQYAIKVASGTPETDKNDEKAGSIFSLLGIFRRAKPEKSEEEKEAERKAQTFHKEFHRKLEEARQQEEAERRAKRREGCIITLVSLLAYALIPVAMYLTWQMLDGLVWLIYYLVPS